MKTGPPITALAASAAKATLMLLLVCANLPLMAQQTSTADNIVPSMVKFSGTLSGADGKPLIGTVGVTFFLYKEQTGGAPLWLETQNVKADNNGHYSVMLGAASAHGLPTDVFVGGDARWLAVQPSGQAEQPRTLLLSVPYALKALDAETLGGKPVSAFLTAPTPGTHSSGTQGAQPTSAAAAPKYPIGCSSATGCNAAYVPLYTSNGGNATVSDSIMTQTGTCVVVGSSCTIAVNGKLTTKSSSGGLISTMTGAGNGIAALTGSATSPGGAGFTFGVVGESSSTSGRGVFGLSTGNGGVGVIGENNNGTGMGVVGKALPSSGTGAQGYSAGVWGDTGRTEVRPTTNVAGVLGTADGGAGGLFINNTPSNLGGSGFAALAAFALNSQGNSFEAWNAATGMGCVIDPTGHLTCLSTGSLVKLDGGKRKVSMSAIESPNNWFEDFGSARLINGVAVVRLDPDFMQTVNTEKDYRVFPVPNGDCKGLYIASKTIDSFEVRELSGGTSNVSFDYRITAIRRKFETVRFADHSNDPDPSKILGLIGKHAPASSAPVNVGPTLSSTQAASHN
jgi:hypothetical protein